MKNYNITLSQNFHSVSAPTNFQIEALPFYIKEAGFVREARFTRGEANNYKEYLLLYALDDMKFTKNKQSLPVHEHDVIFSSCYSPLQFSSPRTKPARFFYVVVCGNQIQYLYNLTRKSNSLYHTNPLGPIENLFIDLIHIDFQSNPLMNQMEAGTILYTLLLELYKLSVEILEIKQITPVQDDAVTTAMKYIHNHYQEDLSIDAICEKVSFSKYYFCKLFREYTNMTIHEYVTEYRINKSKELLSYSKMPIGNVATAVGFKNTLTYTRCFEKQTHMTPTEYRQAY